MGGGEDREEADEAGKEEEDTGAQIAPIVKLDEVTVTTGEEHEDVLIDLKAKLYRFDKEGNQWKERGAGQIKLLEHKENKKIRLLMRQNRTLKICANHLVSPAATLQEHAGSDKSWVWHANDFSEGKLQPELFCIRFGSIENAQKFKDAYEGAQEKSGGRPVKEEDEEAADEAADLLDDLKVTEETPEAGTTEEKAPEAAATEEKAPEAATTEKATDEKAEETVEKLQAKVEKTLETKDPSPLGEKAEVAVEAE